MNKTRILLADDHLMLRQALRVLLEAQPDLQVVGEANDGEELLKVATKVAADVVLMDIGMPNLNGIEATKRLLATQPNLKVIGLSGHSDRNFVLDLMKAGALAYVTKTGAGEEVLRAIRAVRVNRRYLCAEVADVVTNALVTDAKGEFGAVMLSSRERQVLQLVTEGRTSAQIAESLHISLATVDVHRRNIMRKLDIHTVAELTKYAIRNGLTIS